MSKTRAANSHADRPIDRLLRIMARLRDPENGCPWDVKQDFASIAPYTIEEAYEVADAIEREDLADLRDELGDLLLQVVFHARMAEEAAHFDFEDVAEAISNKMVRRHPHVFGEAQIEGAEAVKQTWEEIKAAERQEKASDTDISALDGVARGLPALLRALKLQKRAAKVGFDWPEPTQVLDKIEEEIAELRQELTNGGGAARLQDELGDLLFALVNLGRHLDVDPEGALRHTNTKFERRFKAMEAKIRAQGARLEDTPLEEQEAGWLAAKTAEREKSS